MGVSVVASLRRIADGTAPPANQSTMKRWALRAPPSVSAAKVMGESPTGIPGQTCWRSCQISRDGTDSPLIL